MFSLIGLEEWKLSANGKDERNGGADNFCRDFNWGEWSRAQNAVSGYGDVKDDEQTDRKKDDNTNGSTRSKGRLDGELFLRRRVGEGNVPAVIRGKAKKQKERKKDDALVTGAHVVAGDVHWLSRAGLQDCWKEDKSCSLTQQTQSQSCVNAVVQSCE
jgi:hypothetical protein